LEETETAIAGSENEYEIERRTMKMKYPLAVLAAAIAMVGCERQKPADSKPAAEITPPVPEVKAEVKEPVRQASKPPEPETKDQFVASVQKKLSDLDQKITKLGDTIESLQENTEAKKALENVRNLRAELGPLFDSLKQSRQEAWQEAKKGVESAMANLEKAFEYTRSSYAGN